MRIVAIDQGTTSTRGLRVEGGGLTDPGTTATLCHSAKHTQHFPQAGWVEHDPMELIHSIRACLDAAGPIDAIGLDNQGESCLAWDRLSGEPLSPVIVWQDNRTSAEIDRLKAAGVESETLARAGLPLDPYFSAAKLAWLLRERPEVRRAAAEGRVCLGTTDAFFLQQLSGRCVTDVTTASRTSLMNLETLSWDPELCRIFGVPMAALPEIVPSAGALAEINGVPVTASLVDQQAALYGHGCRLVGDSKVTFGTGAFALAVTGETIVRAPERGLLPTVAWGIANDPVVRAVDGGVYDAGAAIDWATRIGLIRDYSDLDSLSGPPAMDRGVAFVPALSGLACPHWDRSAAALWIGMTSETSAVDLRKALLEGIALRTAEVIEALGSHVTLTDTLSIDGGLARNAYFAQFLANAIGRTVVTRDVSELTAVGTAELAARGAGLSLRIATGQDRPYQPRDNVPASTWRARFSEAVAKTRGWR